MSWAQSLPPLILFRVQSSCAFLIFLFQTASVLSQSNHSQFEVHLTSTKAQSLLIISNLRQLLVFVTARNVDFRSYLSISQFFVPSLAKKIRILRPDFLQFDWIGFFTSVGGDSEITKLPLYLISHVTGSESLLKFDLDRFPLLKHAFLQFFLWSNHINVYLDPQHQGLVGWMEFTFVCHWSRFPKFQQISLSLTRSSYSKSFFQGLVLPLITLSIVLLHSWVRLTIHFFS